MTQKPRLLVHTSRQSIRWGDMDALGHVNNVTYFRYLEQARIEWVYGLHPAGDAYESSDPVIVNASCTFLEPLVYPGDIEVRMYLGDPGRTSIGSYYEIWMNGRQYADGAAKMVWIDLASGRSVPVPDAVARAAAGTGERNDHRHDALAAVAATASRGRTSPISRGASRRGPGARFPITPRSGAGRTRSARRSGAKSGTMPASSGRAASARSSTRTRMPGARWFPDARLNFAENLLTRRAADDARRCAGLPRRGQARPPRFARGTRRRRRRGWPPR